MKTLKMISFFFVLFMSCNAQNKDPKNDISTKPDENIQVNKEYDEFGNLIKYDSIYSYSYSSNGKSLDSLKLQFQNHFNSHSFFNDSFFDDFFKSDSISGGFNPDNFFYDGFINQNEHIKSMMKRMDSIQKLFFDQNDGNFNPIKPETEDLDEI